MALQTKNFSEQFADQKLSHAKFAENIVKQISEGQERTEASQERFSNELFDVRQDVAKNGIFARLALTPAIFFFRRPHGLRPTLPRRLAAWLWPTACVAPWPSTLSTRLAGSSETCNRRTGRHSASRSRRHSASRSAQPQATSK